MEEEERFGVREEAPRWFSRSYRSRLAGLPRMWYASDIWTKRVEACGSSGLWSGWWILERE